MSLSNGKKIKKSIQKKCEHCGAMFHPTRSWNRFCTKQCQWKDWDRRNPRVSEPPAPAYHATVSD